MRSSDSPVDLDIIRYIRYGTEANMDTFDALARRVFQTQHERNPTYRRFCDGRGMDPACIAHWQDIPPAPASAFKRFALTCAPEAVCVPERAGRTFHSSGTTGNEVSRHFMDYQALTVYRASLEQTYRDFVEGESQPLPILALMPPPDAAPHSSLSFMLGELVQTRTGQFFQNIGWQQSFAKGLRCLDKPHVLFGTAFAWVLFFDAIGESFALPEGTIVIETGGFKGRSREISRDELYQMFTDRLGVPDSHCIAEYGMSEMASQFYDNTLYDLRQGVVRPRRKIAPPWLRTRVLDPITGNECAHGVPGLLAHYDLANLNSVMAIQTEDMGYTLADGGFVLLGRAPGAILRGCSLLAESVMGNAVE